MPGNAPSPHLIAGVAPVHKVELCSATLPPPIGLCAAHYWFVTWHHDACHRWEVWQTKHAGGRSFGHVHVDLKPPHAGVGGGRTRHVAEWRGSDARAIVGALESFADYPHCHRYVAWPGPNSNTFVAWVLQRAGIHHALGWNALGKRYGAQARHSRFTLRT